MSGSEIILYGYGIVCICMLIFNIVYDVLQKDRDRRLDEKNESYAGMIRESLSVLRSGGTLGEDTLHLMCRRLGKVNNLVAFERALSSLDSCQDRGELKEYRRQIQPVLLELAEVYSRREDIQAAYFAFFLSRQELCDEEYRRRIQEILLDYMRRDNLYCRVNTLQTLCAFGTAELLAEAISIQDSTGSFFHEKVLTDSLLTFSGNHDELIALLWRSFPQFTQKTRLAVLNYIRFCTGEYAPEMQQIMTDPHADKELRLSAIRYFGKYPREEVRDILKAFAVDKAPTAWEYAAVSVSCLASYPGEDVTAVLMEAAHSSNWYVRRNAAASLDALGLDHLALVHMIGGQDRYAREMMMYQLERCQLRENRVKTEEATV